jgi:hypothetical protein
MPPRLTALLLAMTIAVSVSSAADAATIRKSSQHDAVDIVFERDLPKKGSTTTLSNSKAKIADFLRNSRILTAKDARTLKIPAAGTHATKSELVLSHS